MGCCTSQPIPTNSNTSPNTPSTSTTRIKQTLKTWTSDTPMTLSQLTAQRNAFWETASSYEGKLEIWTALKTMCESADLSLSQAIVESLGLKLVTGHLEDGVWDESGVKYVLPLYCLVEPNNLCKSSQEKGGVVDAVVDVDVNVKFRMSDGKDKELVGKNSMSVGQLKRLVGVNNAKCVYFGKLLKDETLLGGVGYKEGTFIQVLG